MPTVLLVDDEGIVLSGMGRLLRGRGFEVVAFQSPAEALRAMPDIRPDVVLSDHHMPEMTGVDLLAEVQKASPRAGRVLMTGNPSLGMLVGAINDSHVDLFVSKPIDPVLLAADLVRVATQRRPRPPQPVRVADIRGDELFLAALVVGTGKSAPVTLSPLPVVFSADDDEITDKWVRPATPDR